MPPTECHSPIEWKPSPAGEAPPPGRLAQHERGVGRGEQHAGLAQRGHGRGRRQAERRQHERVGAEGRNPRDHGRGTQFRT
jgi:hypothetical protein